MRRTSNGALFVLTALLLAGGVSPAASQEWTARRSVIGALAHAASVLWSWLTEEEIPPDQRKQRQTLADLRNLGTALFSWLTDQVAAGAAGEQQVVKLADYPQMSPQELEKLLVPKYLQSVPKHDGWGHPYELRVRVGDVQSRHVMLLRSPGRDGRFSDRTGTYVPGPFPMEQYDEDLVWADGYFVRWPERAAPTPTPAAPGARHGDSPRGR